MPAPSAQQPPFFAISYRTIRRRLMRSLRVFGHGPNGPVRRPAQEHDFYDELSRINNELVNARRELTKRNAELARVDAEKNQFLGMVVHDLRNPLTVIQAYSEFLSELKGRVIGPRELQFINSIYRSSEFDSRAR